MLGNLMIFAVLAGYLYSIACLVRWGARKSGAPTTDWLSALGIGFWPGAIRGLTKMVVGTSWGWHYAVVCALVSIVVVYALLRLSLELTVRYSLIVLAVMVTLMLVTTFNLVPFLPETFRR